ncbi:melanoma-associated antigen B2-like [Molossus molossus]|uniref:melanoma-associated antigen B2-like n=1 Tax=Molossus molossus TaxID=27622 RepID=UPI001746D387|nr:melanoma-associated antigen B2-like [Molossus molossus]
MPRGHKSKLRARDKRRQNRTENQDVKSAEVTTGEEEVAACTSSSVLGDVPSCATSSCTFQEPPSTPATTSATAGASSERSVVKAKGQVWKSKNYSLASTSTEGPGQDLLNRKVIMLVQYLLCQYKRKEPIKKADMMKIIHKWYRKDFPDLLRRASERMEQFFGLEVKEVKPNSNYYTLVSNQDNTSEGSLSSGFTFPKKGILMPVLGVIFLNGNRASEEETWKFLNELGICDGKCHFLFGEPRKLITQDLVQEKYLVYQQVPSSDPPCYEFLWGPRAQAETSKLKVLEYLADLNGTVPSAYTPHYEEALKDEEDRTQTRALAALSIATPSEATGRSRAASSCYPVPE